VFPGLGIRNVAKEDEERAHKWKMGIRGLPDPGNDEPDDTFFFAGGAMSSRGPPSVLATSGQQAIRDGRGTGTPVIAAAQVPRTYLKSDQPPLTDRTGEHVPLHKHIQTLHSARRAPSATREIDGGDETLYLPDQQEFQATRARAPRSLQPNSARGPRALAQTQPAVRTGGFQLHESRVDSQIQADLASLAESASKNSLNKLQETPPRSSRKPSQIGATKASAT